MKNGEEYPLKFTGGRVRVLQNEKHGLNVDLSNIVNQYGYVKPDILKAFIDAAAGDPVFMGLLSGVPLAEDKNYETGAVSR